MPQRALDFTRLDAGSIWSNGNATRVLVPEGKLSEERATVQKLPSEVELTKLDKACFDRPSPQSAFRGGVLRRRKALAAMLYTGTKKLPAPAGGCEV